MRWALEHGKGLLVDLDVGEVELAGDDLEIEWDYLAPGEGFEVRGIVHEDGRVERFATDPDAPVELEDGWSSNDWPRLDPDRSPIDRSAGTLDYRAWPDLDLEAAPRLPDGPPMERETAALLDLVEVTGRSLGVHDGQERYGVRFRSRAEPTADYRTVIELTPGETRRGAELTGQGAIERLGGALRAWDADADGEQVRTGEEAMRWHALRDARERTDRIFGGSTEWGTLARFE